jgi:membrane-bound lytic murein transglycosylase MltF
MKNIRCVYDIILASAVAVLALWIGFSMRGDAFPVRDFREINAEKTIRVVTEYSANGYFVSADSIAGFQYELCRAMERHFGWKVEFVLENNLAASVAGLKEQRYDLIARNIPVTTENRGDILFVDPILLDRQILVQRTAQYNHDTPPIRNQIDLRGKTLHIPENSPGILRLKNLSEEIADTIYIVEEKQYAAEQLIYMVARGDIDFAVTDRQTAMKYLSAYPELDIGTDIGFTQMLSWAVRNESPVLLDSLNAWLNVFKTGKEFERMKGKYLYSNKIGM